MNVLGVGISVRFSFFVLAAILAFERLSHPPLLIQWLVVVTLSVLAHEFGHAFAFRRFGHGSRITLHGMGGSTQSTGGPDLSALQSAFVSVAGPLAGFGVALLGWGAVKAAPFVIGAPLPDRLVFDLLWVNVGWSIINLLPIVPMDGGHILQHMLRHWFGEKGEIPALVVSLGFAVFCGAAAYYAGWTYSLIMVAWFAASNFQAIREVRRHRRLAGVREVMREAVEAYYASQLSRAGRLALSALEQTQDPEAQHQLRMFVLAVEQAARAGKGAADDQSLAPLRTSAPWQAVLHAAQAAQAAQKAVPTQIFTD